MTHQDTEKDKMFRGEPYFAGDPSLQANRTRCKLACQRFNAAGEVSRRERVTLWRE